MAKKQYTIRIEQFITFEGDDNITPDDIVVYPTLMIRKEGDEFERRGTVEEQQTVKEIQSKVEI